MACSYLVSSTESYLKSQFDLTSAGEQIQRPMCCSTAVVLD